MASKFVQKLIPIGEKTLTLETGLVARQADGAVIARIENTVVLATVVANKKPITELQGFFPLTVDYIERTYAAGRFPGGYFKREGRPSEHEILVSREIDRALRPMFPDGFENEVQVIVTLLSLDAAVSPDVIALVAASAAVGVAGIPFNGPVVGVRVGYQDGMYLVNPANKALEHSALDLVVAGTENAVIMVESEAHELSETVMLGALQFGHSHIRSIVQGIKEFVAEAGKQPWQWTPPVQAQALIEKVNGLVATELDAAYRIYDKLERKTRIAEIYDKLIAQLINNTENSNANSAEDAPTEAELQRIFSDLEKKIVRKRILQEGIRIDGRDNKTVRTITIKPSFLPRTHGSVLFTRGETQALVVATLGTEKDAQTIDMLEGEYKERFMLHYNFPPYCVGELGSLMRTKRREIGHGNLAKRALQAVLPDEKDFPYVIRAVSEITESNGSSSMATVCGTSLALMDAGVPVKAPVAGIAMGLIKEGEKFVVLTDILGDEDHLGDMDFKVAGTEKGVTALQMDIKIDGITPEIMELALTQAKQARFYILEVMNGVLHTPRAQVSAYAPRITTLKIDTDKIRDVIGKGGATIRSITEETNTTINISEDGLISIAAYDQEAGDAALNRILAITTDIEIGGVYEGKVTRLADFGAFVMLPSGKEGLLHISQIANERVNKVSDYLNEGQVVQVKVLDMDRQGRIKLSMRALSEETHPAQIHEE